MKIKKNIISHELLFSLYFWGFTILKKILQLFSQYSSYILLIYATIIISISILISSKNNKITYSYSIVFGMFFIFFVDLLFRNNQYIFKYMYEFIIYGVIPIYLMSQIKDIRRLFNLLYYFSIILFILYAMDPFRNYEVFGDYMAFGFNLALPSYFGMYIGRKFLHKKKFWLIEILCLIELILYSNRSTVLSVIFLYFLVEIFYEKVNLKKIVKVFSGIIGLIVILIFIKEILQFSISLLSKLGLYSQSLRRIQQAILEDSMSELFSGRLEIWNIAKIMIQDNLLFGSGTGAFQARYNLYSHNIYYDIMIQYGIIGLSILAILIYSCIKKIKISTGYNKLLGIFLLASWCPKLFFSIYIFKDIGIWCFLAYGFLKFEDGNIEEIDCL